MEEKAFLLKFFPSLGNDFGESKQYCQQIRLSKGALAMTRGRFAELQKRN
jgi:hypothetical protein